MCRICEGNPFSLKTFNEFKSKARESANNFDSLTTFLSHAKAVDKLRFDSGNEWGEPKISQSVTNLIFANPGADEGLLLFTLGCWLDMQAKYTVVWNSYLKQAKKWLQGNEPLPRAKFELTAKHLLLTKSSITKIGSLSLWFTLKINQIAKENGEAKGNIYRLAGAMCHDLYSKPEAVDYLRKGMLPKQFSGGDHKRFWMFLMFLRRDNSVVKCLFSRALSKIEGGNKAVQYWYNDKYFDPLECELPVDTWVLKNWNKMSKKLNHASFKTNYTAQVAARARELALKANMSPSMLDAMLFYS